MKRWGENSAVQKIKTNPIVLATVATSAAVPTAASVYFRVPIPDSRLRTKVSVLFIGPAGNVMEYSIVGFANLWLFETEDDTSGVAGRTIPTTNLEGTEAAPTGIAATAPLLGYSREFASAADNIEGKFTILTNVTLGTWTLQTRYQPDAVRFTNEEWDEIARGCQPTLTSSPFTF